MMIRKGPWTEQEDVQLVFYVNLLGDRRWDFIAKVSGLKRTGKSCRLRWVNYLHPGLKRGKMTPHEERLVLQLHSKWGNRWSRIAQKLPGRTDNEIKNYWRTHMRKKAQENKRASSPSSSSISNCSSTVSSSSNLTCGGTCTVDSVSVSKTDKRSFYDTGGLEIVDPTLENNDNNNVYRSVEQLEEEGCYSMDEIWKDIDLLEDGMSKPIFNPYSDQTMSSQIWDYHWPDSFPAMSMIDSHGQGQGEVDNNPNTFFPVIARLTG